MQPGLGMPTAQGPDAEEAFAALSSLSPRSPNPTQGFEAIRKAFDLIHQLTMAVIPQVSQMNPKVAKDLHVIGQRVLTAKSDLMQEAPLQPPPDLMAGMGAGGAPSLGGTSMPGARSGGGSLSF